MSTSLAFLLFVYYLCFNFFLAASNINTNRFLNNSETIESSDGRFKMGFFSPGNTTNRYFGIWYNIKDDLDFKEVVWVANRNNPVNNSLGVLKISEDGNLQLVDGEDDMVIWSSNVSYLDNTTVAELRDTGNLVLLSSAGGKIVWQSFEHVTNTLVPLMTLSINMSLDHNLYKDEFDLLRSWKSTSDPSDGRFAMRLTPSLNATEYVIVKDNDELYWRTGPWNGRGFIGIPNMVEQMIYMLYKDTENTLDVLYSPANETMLEHLVLNYDGNFVIRKWDDDTQKMITFWGSIQSACDTFGYCGPFGRCNSRDSPICNCLDGFHPKNINEWRKGNWTSGCVRKTPLQCGNTTHNNNRADRDGFLRLQHMKVPFYISSFPFVKDHQDCRRTCLENCTCLAYAYPEGIYRKSYGCMIWDVSLIDIQEFPNDGADLFIRLAHSEIVAMSSRNTKIIVIVAVTVAVVAVLFVVFSCCFWSRICRRFKKSSVDAGVDQAEFKDLRMFKFKELEFATTNFSESNKLGEGGFGPVYKGKLENGQEIAVKRLSRTSGQGLQEFMNEVIMISKLQHKNLVKLLGCCCVGRDEKLLIYEFMPNKSLDAILFDSHHQKQLDWKKRLNIVNGICRGLLYLHRDSRLKIIHRDLKASNILLDEELNPKISDFGLARIFETKQDQANTLKIVGTYGYMSPEYAMEGLYSEKSDIYSLGVLLLEIVSGRKNSSFRNYESLGLLAHTWKLWNENDIQSLIDPTILDNASSKDEILKCIQLGLLSVQEKPKDRPTASALVSMLDVNDIMELPYPTQPGYIQMNASSSEDIIQSSEEQGSVNQISLTAISGR